MSKTQDKIDQLTAEQTAVLQLVTIEPAPRTEAELVGNYAGQAFTNQWPEQSESSVKSALKSLVSKGLVKEGEKAPDDSPTYELTSAADAADTSPKEG